MSDLSSYHIGAVAVNHNTSAYVELLLRSFFATHDADLRVSFTILDNQSDDDQAVLKEFMARKKIPFVPSGYTRDTEWNSHGDALRRFVLEHPDYTHYLFLDADVCFFEPNSVHGLLEELDREPRAFGIMPRFSGDGDGEVPEQYHGVYTPRLHPCCALVKNTPVFRRVVELIGLGCDKRLWAEQEEYLDTFQLMTRVMRTHELDYLLSPRLVIHFFSVTYEPDPEIMAGKDQRRDRRLAALRLHASA